MIENNFFAESDSVGTSLTLRRRLRLSFREGAVFNSDLLHFCKMKAFV